MPRSLKALLISGSYYPSQVGGISRLMAGVASTLGRDHICVLTGAEPDQNCPDDPEGPKIYRIPSLFRAPKIRKALPWASALWAILRKDRPEVVVLSSLEDSNLGLWLQKKLNLPLVVFVHGNEVLATLKDGYAQPLLALQKASRIIAISKYTAELVKGAGVEAARIHIVPPRVDVERFRPVAIDEAFRKQVLGPTRYAGKVILTVGNIVPRKGHDVVIRSLPLIKSQVSDFTYLIVGDGPYREELEQLADLVGVKDCVKFAGKVPDETLSQYYALSDVFIMASRGQENQADVEGFGLVYLEASACAKPVIGGRSGGVSDAVEDGVSGLLVDPESPEDVAAAILRVLGNPQLATRLGQQGLARAVNEFGWNSFRESFLDMLSDVVHRSDS